MTELPMDELIEKLQKWDIVTLVEVLEITNEELLDLFYFRVEAKYDDLLEAVDE